MRTLFAMITLFLLLALNGCDSRNTNSYDPVFHGNPHSVQEYVFAIHPLHNPTRLYENFNPLMEYLNQHIPHVRFKVEASRDYQSFDEKLKNRSVPFALPNPYQTLIAIDNRYRVIAKIADDNDFKGIILVRKDSQIRQVADLKGKAVSYPAPSALAATMLPQAYLHSHGLDVNHDIDNRYVGSQESAIMNVYLGNTAAGATWPSPWRALGKERPEVQQALKVMWETETLPNNSVVVRDDVPEALARQVQTLLTHLHESDEGRDVIQKMGLSAFSSADNRTYDKVKEFITAFSQTVRPLESVSNDNNPIQQTPTK
ncbi:phosphate/phosphite/phosphonate ABC transporter substrate-binding protein [Thiomicrorhabdus cannonii]|uniref:phosphate/phosphite/phosphonate ABC transporter substrate-binding protein n=1 Tax=Thiomicrorhabdus cannonii TaxID=2748011 RepID=UPI0015BC0DC9|nr:phosphate/phosphite/phosphonate ABC transporter substrate-binding protein [Thiomicrorhabdus cannonii]